METFFKS